MKFEVEDRVWTVLRETVLEGDVEAAGPEYLLVRVTGPYSNFRGHQEKFEVARTRPGNAPRLGFESQLSYASRCLEILDREDDVKKLEAEAERLGYRVVPK